MPKVQLRDDLFQKCKILNKYFNAYGDEEKFIWIMSNEDINKINCLGTFIAKSLKTTPVNETMSSLPRIMLQ